MALAEINTPLRSACPTDNPSTGTTAVALVIGRPIPLHQDLRSGLVDQGVEMIVRNPYANSDQLGDATHANLPALQGEPIDDSMPTKTIMVTTQAMPVRRGILSRWRDRAAKSEENNRLAAAAVDASSNYSTCRLLVLCEGRDIPLTGAQAHDAKRLAQRLKYEIEVGGTAVVSTSYLVVGTTPSLCEAIEAIARWCRRETAPLPTCRRTERS